jgi:hypothetical protein
VDAPAELTHDEQRPLLAEHAEGGGDRALLRRTADVTDVRYEGPELSSRAAIA